MFVYKLLFLILFTVDQNSKTIASFFVVLGNFSFYYEGLPYGCFYAVIMSKKESFDIKMLMM